MKSFTDLPQSNKLAEILPLESADIVWVYSAFEDDYFPHFRGFGKIVTGAKDIKAWSLAALLDVLPDYTLQTNTDGTVFVVCDSKKPMISDAYDNPVDACVELIEQLRNLESNQ